MINQKRKAGADIVGISMDDGKSVESENGITKLDFFGDFDRPEKHREKIQEMIRLSTVNRILEIRVSSDGGRVDTLLEYIEAMSHYDTVITICNSSACSAGAMLWSMGTVRVTSEFATLMFHRESYGYQGKLDAHEELIAHVRKTGVGLMERCCVDILTEAEMERARVTEVFRTGADMVERGAAIYYNEYRDIRKTAPTRYSEVATLLRDTVTGDLLAVDEEGIARTVAAVSMSDYSFPMVDHTLGVNFRVTQSDGVQETLTADEFNDLEEAFTDKLRKMMDVPVKADDEVEVPEEEQEEITTDENPPKDEKGE